jgi:hypothetical protein
MIWMECYLVGHGGVRFQDPDQSLIKWNLNVGGGHYGEPIVAAPGT